MNADQLSTYAPIVISAVSLGVSIISSILNYRLNLRDKKRGEQLAEVQLRLQELQLQREEETAEKRASSKVEARHVLVGLKGHRIRISNTGGTSVTSVTCKCDCSEGNTPYAFLQDKEPYEILEPGESFDETIIFADGSPRKFVIKTYWIDENDEEHSRDNIISW